MFNEIKGLRTHEITYSDCYDREQRLTDDEITWFETSVSEILAKLGTNIEVYIRDHEKISNTRESNATALYCYTLDGSDEFITVDAYIVHDLFKIEHGAHTWLSGLYTGDERSLATIICHELTHRRYHRHDRYHRKLTDELISKCA